MLGVDILGPLPLTVGRRSQFIIVFTEYYTKYPICIAVQRVTAEVVARAFTERWFMTFGAVEKIVSDRGPQFMSEVFTKLCKIHNMEHLPTTAYNPQRNGLVERFNHTLCVMLSTFVHDKPREWDKYVDWVTLAYQLTPHPSTGIAPAEAMMNFKPKTMFDTILPEVSLDITKSPHEYLEEQKRIQQDTHKNINQRLQQARENQREYFNDHHRFPDFQVGDRVWFYWPSRKQNLEPLKLQLPWSGPYFIAYKKSTQVFRLMRPDGLYLKQYVHVARLKHCPATTGSPTEFITLHENDTFDPLIERMDIDPPQWIPIIEDKPPEEREEPLDDKIFYTGNFTDLPTLPTLEKLNIRTKELRDERLKLKQIADLDKRKNLQQVEQKEQTLKRKIQRLKQQSERNDRKKRGESYIDNYENSSQQFLDLTTESPPLLEYKERTDDFHEPKYQKDLYEQLLNTYITYRDLPHVNLNKVKEILRLIFSSPRIDDMTRIGHFYQQVKSIKSHDELIDFLYNCLSYFEQVFRIEIERDKKHLN